MELNDVKIVNNTEQQRFELPVEGFIAFIDYQMENGAYALIHTEVPEALGGRGIGRVLVAKTLNYLEGSGARIIPYCPFVVSYIKRNPEWNRIVVL